MNDTTVRCQNASVTEPKREKGDREAVDEVSLRMTAFLLHSACPCHPKCAMKHRLRRI